MLTYFTECVKNGLAWPADDTKGKLTKIIRNDPLVASKKYMKCRCNSLSRHFTLMQKCLLHSKKKVREWPKSTTYPLGTMNGFHDIKSFQWLRFFSLEQSGGPTNWSTWPSLETCLQHGWKERKWNKGQTDGDKMNPTEQHYPLFFLLFLLLLLISICPDCCTLN